MRRRKRLASIDVGTNSTRLLVADCDGERTRTVDRRMIITRLGRGVDESHRLSPAAVERTAAVLKDYRAVLDTLEPEGVRAAATSALRDCGNGWEFLDLAGEIIGCRPEILAGEEEARMSFLGALSDLEAECGEGDVLVFDVGGGSTEIIVGGRAARPAPGSPGFSDGPEKGMKLRSVDVGCVRMSERFLSASDPPSPVEVGRMESHLVRALKPAMEQLLPGELSIGVGLAGTVTTLSAIKQGLKEYDTERIHHSRLSREDVEELFVNLASVDLSERKRVMGLEPGRADVIVGGAAVLRVIMDLAGLTEILVSEKDILDGLVIDAYGRSA